MTASTPGRRGAAKAFPNCYYSATTREIHRSPLHSAPRSDQAEVGDCSRVSKSERLNRYCFFLAVLCLHGVGSAGWAQGFIDETRIGILEPIDGPPGDKYGSPNVNVEVLFDRFGPEYQSSVLNHFLRPRLDIGTSISTDGDTSEFYAGLTWDVFLTRRLFLEGSAGGALTRGRPRLRLHRQFSRVWFRRSSVVGAVEHARHRGPHV